MEKLPHGRPSHGRVAPVDEVRVCTLPFVSVAVNFQLCAVVRRREKGRRRRRERNMMLALEVVLLRRVEGRGADFEINGRHRVVLENMRDETWVLY